MSDLCDGLARWATSLELEAIPQPVAQATRRALVDATGCMLAGATTPVSQTLRHQAAGVFTSGRCRVLGNALRLNPLGAAQLNGAAAGTLEMDPGFESGRVPAVGVVFAAVLAATEQTGTPRGDMFTGLVVGLEVAARLSFLLRDGLDAAPDDLATQICAISAALGTARALALDEDAAAQAMRIAASIHGGLALTSGTSVRPLQMGLAAEAAVRAVLLADSGMGGPDSAVEGEQALGRYAAATMPLHRAMNGLGTTWLLQAPGLVYRLHPAAPHVLPALEETARLLAEHRLPPADVASVTCHLGEQVIGDLFQGKPQIMAHAQYDLSYVIGCLLSFGTYGIAHLKRSVMAGPTLVENAAKVQVATAKANPGDEEHLARTPFAAKITIQAHDGRRLQGLGRIATGYPEQPLDDKTVEEKFVANARFTGLDEAQARLMAARMWDMPH